MTGRHWAALCGFALLMLVTFFWATQCQGPQQCGHGQTQVNGVCR